MGCLLGGHHPSGTVEIVQALALESAQWHVKPASLRHLDVGSHLVGIHVDLRLPSGPGHTIGPFSPSQHILCRDDLLALHPPRLPEADGRADDCQLTVLHAVEILFKGLHVVEHLSPRIQLHFRELLTVQACGDGAGKQDCHLIRAFPFRMKPFSFVRWGIPSSFARMTAFSTA